MTQAEIKVLGGESIQSCVAALVQFKDRVHFILEGYVGKDANLSPILTKAIPFVDCVLFDKLQHNAGGPLGDTLRQKYLHGPTYNFDTENTDAGLARLRALWRTLEVASKLKTVDLQEIQLAVNKGKCKTESWSIQVQQLIVNTILYSCRWGLDEFETVRNTKDDPDFNPEYKII